MKNQEINPTINQNDSRAIDHQSEKHAAKTAEFDALAATKRMVSEVQGYLAETPAEHLEKIQQQSAPLRHSASGFVKNVLDEGMKQGAELKAGTDGLNKIARDNSKNYPLESTLTAVGAVGAVGCGAVAVMATAPEVIGLGILGTVGFGGVALYNGATPHIKNANKFVNQCFDKALSAKPQW